MTDKLLNELLPYLLQRASYLVTQQFHETLKLNEISVGRWRMMAWLSENEPCSITDLTKELMLKQPSVTRMVEAARKDGLVDTRQDEEDRRRVHVTLSPEGRRLIDELRTSARASDQIMVDSLGKSRSGQIKKTLHQIIDHYEG
jgi:MarR family transcriptional regulator, organic hydroperoxide resistance regulator